MRVLSLFLFLFFFSFSITSAQEVQKAALSLFIDHSVFSELLKKFVNKRGMVDYKAFKRDEQALKTLTAYTNDLMKIDGLKLEPAEERMSYWLNLYNALIVQKILKHYPVPSVLQIPHFFDEPRYEMKSFPGEKLSLLDLEKKVFLEQFTDPRLHLARVNGAIGSAPLFPEAYQAPILDKKLEEASMTFFTDSAKISYDSKKSILYVSPLFLWFEKSFLVWGVSSGHFIRKRLPNLPPTAKIEFSGFDWKLNDAKY